MNLGGVVVSCDRCELPFDEEERVPTILPDCAHTLCSTCIQEIITSSPPNVCPLCGRQINSYHSADDFRVNYKLLSLLNDPSLGKLHNFFPCQKHQDKPIEIFCKTCSQAVCIRCIYDEHNGHHLLQVEDMSKLYILK